MWALAIMGAGMFMNAMGKQQADAAQADAERQNASYFREQANFIEEAGRRELELFNRKATKTFGDTIGTYSSSGVALTGSVLETLAGERSKAIFESNAIQKETEFKARLARLRADQADDTANSLINAGPMNFLSAGLTGGAQIASAAKG